jgi:RNA polymerase sigma-70 factor, ECF subfamily
MGDPGITALLAEWSTGSPAALERLMPLVAGELRALARHHFRREPAHHTLQPTALVSEVYLRLSDQLGAHFAHRGEFFAFASSLMRRILVDHHRARATAKRGHHEVVVPLDEALDLPHLASSELLALDDALHELGALDHRQMQIVELRFFGGLTVAETAQALAVSPATVKREWASAKAFLLHEMQAS